MRAPRPNLFLTGGSKRPGLLFPNGLAIFDRYDKSAHRLQVIKYLCARYAKIYTDRKINTELKREKHSGVISQSQHQISENSSNLKYISEYLASEIEILKWRLIENTTNWDCLHAASCLVTRREAFSMHSFNAFSFFLKWTLFNIYSIENYPLHPHCNRLLRREAFSLNKNHLAGTCFSRFLF